MKRSNHIWQYLRPILFIILGLFNTVLIRPEDIGSWQNYLGYAFLVLGFIDALVVIRKHRKSDQGEK